MKKKVDPTKEVDLLQVAQAHYVGCIQGGRGDTYCILYTTGCPKKNDT